MDTVLCLDTSYSMSGNRLQQLQAAVLTFTDKVESLGGGQIGIAEFGNNTGLRYDFSVHPVWNTFSWSISLRLTENYSAVRNTVRNLRASGSTPMAEGLVVALKELSDRGRTLAIGQIKLRPRLLLMTDGAPNKKEDVLAVAKAFGEIGIPIACVGVSGCDVGLMKAIAQLSGGMFTYAHQIEELSNFFLKQILLTVYIAQFAERLEALFSREILREFFYEQTGKYLNDDELDAFILYLRTLASQNRGGGGGRIGGGGGGGSSSGSDSSDGDPAQVAAFCCFVLGFCCCLPWLYNMRYCCSDSSGAKKFAIASCVLGLLYIVGIVLLVVFLG